MSIMLLFIGKSLDGIHIIFNEMPLSYLHIPTPGTVLPLE